VEWARWGSLAALGAQCSGGGGLYDRGSCLLLLADDVGERTQVGGVEEGELGNLVHIHSGSAVAVRREHAMQWEWECVGCAALLARREHATSKKSVTPSQ
jgi:hypothetical protein